MIGTDAIIDLSHWNLLDNIKLATMKSVSGIQAVILKASQGLVKDPTFEKRWLLFSGWMLRGAYHFGVSSIDAKQQAEYFMDVVPDSKVIALDWEWNDVNTMLPTQAADFVTAVFDRLGRWPMIYTSKAFTDQIAKGNPVGYRDAKPVLRNCDLWLTGYTKEPVLPSLWSKWTIWQYGIAECKGVVGKCDRNTFNGSLAELNLYFTEGRLS